MGAGAGILEAERLRGDGKFPAPELMMRRRGAGELPLLARSAKALGIEARRVETAQRNEVQRSWLHSREPGRLWRNAHITFHKKQQIGHTRCPYVYIERIHKYPFKSQFVRLISEIVDKKVNKL